MADHHSRGSPMWAAVASDSSSVAALPLDGLFQKLCVTLRSKQRPLEASSESSTSIDIDILVSCIPHTIPVPVETLWDFYFPLSVSLWLKGSRAAPDTGDADRFMVGIAGPAGAGKSTTAQLLSVIGSHTARLLVLHAASSAPTLADDASNTGIDASSASPPYFVALSMDAWHKTNARLDVEGLRADKGAIRTIDGDAFAVDLERAKCTSASTASVLMPEYDRAVTHDPMPGRIELTPATRVVIVEGLYLCRSAPTIDGVETDGTGPTALPDGDGPRTTAWASIRHLLDYVLFLDVPLDVCRSRAITRKAKGNSISLEASAEHFDRVDLPVWMDLQADLAKPLPHGPDLVVSVCVPASEPAPPVNEGTVAAPAGVAYGSVTIQIGSPVPASSVGVATSGDASAEGSSSTDSVRLQAMDVVVVGLNPCMQRTLIFEAPSAGTTGWKRGEVNRAQRAAVAVGGKGQHTAVAVLREWSHSDTPPSSAAGAGADTSSATTASSSASDNTSRASTVYLAQFLGGATGRMVKDLLTRTAHSIAGDSLQHAPGTSTADPGISPARNADALRMLNADIGDDKPTRACITLLDRHQTQQPSSRSTTSAELDTEMTELIEPSPPVSSGQVERLVAKVKDAISTGTVGAVALCGTFPAGADSAYMAIAKAVQEVNDRNVAGSDDGGAKAGISTQLAESSPSPLTSAERIHAVLDAHKDVGALLASGGVSIVKINADELAVLAGASSAALSIDTSSVAQRRQLILSHGAAVLSKFKVGLQHLAITDGPHCGYLISRSSAHSTSAQFSGISNGNGLSAVSLQVWEYHLPGLPSGTGLVNPIGAGDTVTGAMLAHVSRGDPLHVAFAHGLAAGTASVTTVIGAEWDARHAKEVFNGIVMRRLAVFG